MTQVSVIVTTAQQRVQTELTLRSLAAQEGVSPADFDVHVCDDGFEDLSEMVASFRDRLDVHYHVLSPRSVTWRLAACRNLGLRYARGERTLIIDGDIVVNPLTVARHREYGTQAVAVNGIRRHVPEASIEGVDALSADGEPVYAACERLADPALTRHWSPDLCADVEKYFGKPGVRLDVPMRLVSGFQVSYPTELVRSIGGFWEEFVNWGFEERDLHARLERLGMRFLVDFDLVCFHLDHPVIKLDVIERNRRLLETSAAMPSPVRNGGPIVAQDETFKSAHELEFWRGVKSKSTVLRNRWFEGLFTTTFGLDHAFYEGKRLIDIGCGPRGSLEWADMARERVGLDPLAEKYRELGTDQHKMRYVTAGSESIPFPDGHFDVVSTFNSLDHVDDLDATLGELCRVLKPGGTLLLISEVNHEPTPTEPISFSWDILASFPPELAVKKEMHFERSREGVYQSLKGPGYDHTNPLKRPGVLVARLDKAELAD